MEHLWKELTTCLPSYLPSRAQTTEHSATSLRLGGRVQSVSFDDNRHGCSNTHVSATRKSNLALFPKLEC